jgi:large subunit ribosomal protein L9
LKHQFEISLDKRKIHLEHPIRTLGDHEIELHLHADVKGTLKVRVESLTPIIAPASAVAADAKPRTEKRGRYTEGEKAETAEARPKVEKHAKAETTEAKPKGEKPVKAEKAPKAPKAEKKEKKAE